MTGPARKPGPPGGRRSTPGRAARGDEDEHAPQAVDHRGYGGEQVDRGGDRAAGAWAGTRSWPAPRRPGGPPAPWRWRCRRAGERERQAAGVSTAAGPLAALGGEPNSLQPLAVSPTVFRSGQPMPARRRLWQPSGRGRRGPRSAPGRGGGEGAPPRPRGCPAAAGDTAAAIFLIWASRRSRARRKQRERLRSEPARRSSRRS